MHKRKRCHAGDRDKRANSLQLQSNAERSDGPVSDLYIQSYEADVIRGGATCARFLEYQGPSASVDSRSGLIRWGPALVSGDADTIENQHLWVDRYDVRLLLDHLPDFRSDNLRVRSPSPSGWSDLPSDSEDTFFFSPDELDDYNREKRRRLIDRGREERLRALATIDGQEEDADPWGGSDEEPDEGQRELIRRTATHIISSPNPAQLELRIFANYGADKRFAFLRGRWSRVWRKEKERAKQYLEEEARKIQVSAGLASLGGLASYGDSDDDSEKLKEKSPEEPQDIPHAQDDHGSEVDIKGARRARAREWSARRRAQQSASQSEQT